MELLTGGLHHSEIQWQVQSCSIGRSLRETPILLLRWVVRRTAWPPAFWKPSRGQGLGGSLVCIWACTQSLFRTHPPWASIQGATHLAVRVRTVRSLHINLHAHSRPWPRGTWGLQARVPTVPVSVESKVSRWVIIKIRSIHQKKPFNAAMKSLWKQKKANKGKFTGSQKLHSMAVNIMQKRLEVRDLLFKAFPTPSYCPGFQSCGSAWVFYAIW